MAANSQPVTVTVTGSSGTVDECIVCPQIPNSPEATKVDDPHMEMIESEFESKEMEENVTQALKSMNLVRKRLIELDEVKESLAMAKTQIKGLNKKIAEKTDELKEKADEIQGLVMEIIKLTETIEAIKDVQDKTDDILIAPPAPKVAKKE